MTMLPRRPLLMPGAGLRAMLAASLGAGLALTVAAAAATPPPAGAAGRTASAVRQDGQPSQRRVLDDFLHYVRIGRPDLAAANGKALFDTGISDAELATLVDENDLGERVESTLRIGRGMEGVEDLVAELEARLERGRRDLGRDPQRIRDAVQMLTGTRRQQMLAEARLAAAGEHAVPELLKQIVESRNPELEQAAIDMLIKIRRQAVTPLSEALANLDPANQRKVAGILGAIGWPHAGPYLLQLALDPGTPADVRTSAFQALEACGVRGADLSEAWTQLARRYFDEEQSLVAFPTEATNNLWMWDDFVGLIPQPVPTPIFSEIMAMRAAREALGASPDNATALALFVAANLKRENELPEGESDPIFGESPFSPQFYATAAGADSSSRVLTLGLSTYNTPLVRDAIAALRETAGSGNLPMSSGLAQPLIDSLRYPDRRVQYEAALTLAGALPQQSFSGDFAVVPTLASAVRSGDQVFAAVVAPDSEDRAVLVSRLKDQGFTVLNSGSSLASISSDIAAAPGVDLIVIRGAGDFARREVEAARSSNRTAATPVLVVAAPLDKVSLDREFEGDRRVLAWPAGGSDEQFAAAVDAVMGAASGGRITEAEGQQYAIESLDALRTIAISGSPVYKVEDAQAALLEALDTRTGGVRLLVADVLALIDTDEAQQRLFDAALSATDAEQIELLDRVASSARRFGNHAAPRQIDALLELIRSSSGPTADAAARLHGALNLPAANAVKLIVE